jgi:hypothetical protein
LADKWRSLWYPTPLTPSYSLVNYIDFSGTGTEGARPIVIDLHAPVQTRFGRPGYAAVTVPTLGNVGKNVLRGTGCQ